MGWEDPGKVADASSTAKAFLVSGSPIVGTDADTGRTGTADMVLQRTLSPDVLPQQLARQAQQRRLRARSKRTLVAYSDRTPAWTQTGVASPTQRSGIQAEDLACQCLQAHGVCILARNLHAKSGEIDIVCRDANVLVFVEVRRRSGTRHGGAAASVGPRKQARLIRTAQTWLPHLAARYFDGMTPPCRFDVVAVQGEAVQWLKQAFVSP